MIAKGTQKELSQWPNLGGPVLAVVADGGGLWGSVRVWGWSGRWRSLWRGSRALVGTLVAADLDGTLEVDLHGIRELEGLEVCV